MELEDVLAGVSAHLDAVVTLADEQTRAVAEKVAIAAGPAVRLAILQAVAVAAEEATAALLPFPGAPAVAISVEDDRIRVDVHATAADAPAAPARPDDTDANARISLRLPESLKADVEQAAAAEGISVNTWLVRAAQQGLRRAGAAGRSPGGATRRPAHGMSQAGSTASERQRHGRPE